MANIRGTSQQLQRLLNQRQFYEVARQAYPLSAEVTAKPGFLSLPEMLGAFPKRGLGMKVYKKTWPENSYWLVKHVIYTSPKYSRYYGVKYWQGEIEKGQVGIISLISNGEH
mmetsp:Transcript_14824/g.25211  ORF Transcript_14824/g.25211 Transcript_14824/m.25211 type:complete len:112 (-) Transcript_14824:289-624(-)